MLTRRDVQGVVKLIDRAVRRGHDVRPSRVVARNSDGSAQLLRLDGECETRGGQSGYVGEVVSHLPGLVNSRGTSGVAGLDERGTTSALWIESLTPRELFVGDTVFVDVVGAGFRAGLAIDFLLPTGVYSEVVHPGITVLGLEVVDAENAVLEVAISADAEVVVDAPIGYGIRGSGSSVGGSVSTLPIRKASAYSVLRGNQWALRSGGPAGEDESPGSWITCEAYQDGARMMWERGSIELPDDAGFDQAVLLREDSAGFVARESIILLSPNRTTAMVWDVENEVVYSHSPAAGYEMSIPLYLGGWLWFFEIETPGDYPTLRLMKSRADFTGVTLVRSISHSDSRPQNYKVQLPRLCASLSIFIVVVFRDTGDYDFAPLRFLLDGTADADHSAQFLTVHEGPSSADTPKGYGLPQDTGSLYFGWTSADVTPRPILAWQGTGITAPQERWDLSLPGWTLDWGDLPIGMSLSLDGVEVELYDGRNMMRDSVVNSQAAPPVLRRLVDPIDSGGGVYPTALLWRGF